MWVGQRNEAATHLRGPTRTQKLVSKYSQGACPQNPPHLANASSSSGAASAHTEPGEVASRGADTGDAGAHTVGTLLLHDVDGYATADDTPELVRTAAMFMAGAAAGIEAAAAAAHDAIIAGHIAAACAAWGRLHAPAIAGIVATLAPAADAAAAAIAAAGSQNGGNMPMPINGGNMPIPGMHIGIGGIIPIGRGGYVQPAIASGAAAPAAIAVDAAAGFFAAGAEAQASAAERFLLLTATAVMADMFEGQLWQRRRECIA